MGLSSTKRWSLVVLVLVVGAAYVAQRSGLARYARSRLRASTSRSPLASVPHLEPAIPAGEGTRLPGFCLDDIHGRKVCLDDFQGKVLLIDFWASWCEPCKREMPAYEELQQRYAAQGLVVLGIGLAMENAATMEEFARKLNVHYTLLVGSPEVEKRFGILGIPTTILLDRNGIIRKRVVGFEYTSVFEYALKQLL